jgi:F-type H+-transporting ATPase subunit a
VLASLLLAFAMIQEPHEVGEPHAAQESHAGGEAEKFNPGETIIEHVSNSGHEHPLIHLPAVAGIDFSVTKHVFMLWLVAAIVFVGVTFTVRRYLKQDRLVPSGAMNGIEAVVEFVRDSIVRPNVGNKWVNTWALFEVIALIDRFVLHTSPDSFVNKMIHGGTTATANFNVTAGLATVTFLAIILAGSKAHGFVTHWKNIVPHGLHPLIYVLLIPIEIIGMFVRPFALTMRLAANMTGGHIAILSILSFVFLFTEMFSHWIAGVGVGLAVSVPLAVGISALEIIVVLVQAYVFTLLSAVFIGMAIHVHH